MIDKIYEHYEHRLSRSNPILKMSGIKKNINDIPLGINLDIKRILTPFGIFEEDDDDEIGQKIKEAYIKIFKEGIYLGTGFGKIIEFNYAKSSPERFIECYNENAEIYTEYEFKVEVMNKIIPPMRVKKFTQEENPKELDYENKKINEISSVTCINLETYWEDIFNIEINSSINLMGNHILQCEEKSFSENEELRELVDDLKKGIREKLFEKFFETFNVDLKKAKQISKNKINFNEETADEIFVSTVFSKLNGEYEVNELISKYLFYVFNEGKLVGFSNGKKMVIKDIQNEILDYDKMNSMSSKENFDYIKEGLS